MDQLFVLWQLAKKERKQYFKVYVGFIYNEKAYDRVEGGILWQVLRMYDVCRCEAAQRHVRSKARVRINGKLSN